MAVTTEDGTPRVIKKKAPKKKAAKKAAPKKKPTKTKPAAGELVEATEFSYEAVEATDANKLHQWADAISASRVEGALSVISMGKSLAQAQKLCREKCEKHPSGNKSPYNFKLFYTFLRLSKRTVQRAIRSYEVFGNRLETAKLLTHTAMYAICQSRDPEVVALKVDKIVAKGETVDESRAKEIIVEILPNAAGGRVKLEALPPPEVDDKKPDLGKGEVVDDKEGACSRGGDHSYVSDGHGGRYCEKCSEVAPAIEGPKRVKPDAKQLVYKAVAGLIKALRKANLYGTMYAEVEAIHKRVADV